MGEPAGPGRPRLLTALALALGLAAPPGLAESPQLSDGKDGVTCRHYHAAGRLAWQRTKGDWADAKGEPYGTEPYGIADVAPARAGQVVTLDVTPLVREWAEKRHPNSGVFLRALEGNGTVVFHSRETPEAALRPALEIEWADGRRERLAPVADTFLDCSTHRSLGMLTGFRVSQDLSALLLFELPEESDGQVAQAQLTLQAHKHYAGRLAIGAFRPLLPGDAREAVRLSGIAARYKGDRGISKDPDVLLATEFESEDWRAAWTPWSKGVAEVIAEDAGNGFAPLQGRALKTTLLQGKSTALNLRYLFQKHTGSEPEEIYFRYYLRLGEDWSPDLEGGKLPGIAGTYGNGGWGTRKSNGTNGWSIRGAFSRRTITRDRDEWLTPVGSYVYHADMKDWTGSLWGWNLGRAGLLANNRWYAIEQYVKLNTPGERDGVFRAWIDGELVYEKEGIGLRDIDSIRIESVWLNVYHGGRRPSPRDMSLYIDNVVIARRYIGPMAP